MINNKSKPKQSHFRNPFDIDPDFEDQIQQTPINFKNPQQSSSNIINPLPFNPYSIQNTNPQKQTVKQQNNPQSKITAQQRSIPQPITTTKPNISAAPRQNQTQTKNSSISSSIPQPFAPTSSSSPTVIIRRPSQLNQDGDPPLLQDIGIDIQMVKNRAILVLKMTKPDEQTIEQSDLSGPIFIAMCFGMLLLLSGKIHFGDIYAIFVFGNVLCYLLFNFMSQIQIISMYCIMSTLGYAMIPMLLLGFLGIFITMKGTIGIILSLAVAAWASFAASNFIEALMKNSQSDRKLLFMYPLFLFYVSFAMIIIF